jgi:hypothetical protein
MTNYPIVDHVRLRVSNSSSVGYQTKYTFPANAIVYWSVESIGSPFAQLDNGFVNKLMFTFQGAGAPNYSDRKVSGSVFAFRGERLRVGEGSGGGTGRTRFDIFLLGDDPEGYTNV